MTDPTLDLLRTLACLLVVAYHLRTVLGVSFGPANRLIEGGDAGVFIFFVLSGYLLYRPFVRGEVDLVSYGIKRAARILPGYFVALVSLIILTRNALPLEHPIPYPHTVGVLARPSLNIRRAPTTATAKVASLAHGRDVVTMRLEKYGGKYTLNGAARTDWLEVKAGTRTGWVARGYTRLVR